MDKLKTKVLFISLIILALLSIGAVAAADDASDEIISQTQDDFDLSEEIVSDDSEVLSSVASDDTLAADEEETNPDGSSYVTFNFEVMTPEGPKNVSGTTVQKITKGGSKGVQGGWFATAIRGYTSVSYQGKTYTFDHWENATGTILTGDAAGTQYSITGNNVYPKQKFYANGTNYTVLFKAIYTAPCLVTVKFNDVKDINGDTVEDLDEQNSLSSGVSWTIYYAPFDNKIADYRTYDKDGLHYTFSHWEDEEGNTITEDYSKTFTHQPEDYTVNYYAKYDSEVIGNFTLIYTDKFGHGSGSWSSINNYGVDFTHTFRTPADIPSGAVFLYWEREDTKEKYYPNSSDQYQYTITYEEFAGKDVKVYVNAVYDIKTTVKLEEITKYVEDVIDITATITDNVNNAALNGGTATLTIDYGNGNTYTQTVDVEDGQAIFKDVKLENPGDYSYKVEYSRFNYNHHDEGINDYLPSEAESKLHILALNTTVSNESATGKPGDKVSVEFTVTDQNNNPVANGTLTVTVEGTPYTAEVKEGKATFEDIVLPNPGNYSYEVNYEGNDYYNPSVGQLNLTVQKVDVIVTLPEVINYTGAVVDIVVDVIDEYGNPVNEGTVNLVIDFGTKLSNKLMATALSNTAEVSNGKAVFKDITLGEPGKYPSYAQYSGSDYYNEAENTSDVIVLPLNTTTESQDVSGHSGDKKDITADIVDQNGNPVKNGTAVLKVNGKEYTAEVKDGKAIFKDVELPSESTDATIDYLGNEYYNPSSTTIKITISEDEEPEGGDEPINGTEDKTSTANAVKAVSVLPSTGNPIALVILALLTLVSTVSLGNKK